MTEDRICLECERLGVRKAFKRKAFHSHLLVHKMTQIEYAHKYNTEEIIKCFICKKEIYKPIRYQTFRNGANVSTCSYSCSNVARRMITDIYERASKTKKETGFYETERMRKRHLKIAQHKRKNGFWSYEKSRERGIKSQDTVRKRYSDYHKINEKRFETQRKNGNFGKRISNKEIAFATLLQNNFQNVIWQSKIRTKDFNIIFKNMFLDFKQDLEVDFVILDSEEPIIVCFDGVFIHGLDRPITEIARKALVSKFNANIFNKYYSDRSFEEYCQKRNINLVRFDENSFEDFLFDNKKLEPYFTCGASKVIDQFLFMLHK